MLLTLSEPLLNLLDHALEPLERLVETLGWLLGLVLSADLVLLIAIPALAGSLPALVPVMIVLSGLVIVLIISVFFELIHITVCPVEIDHLLFRLVLCRCCSS